MLRYITKESLVTTSLRTWSVSPDGPFEYIFHIFVSLSLSVSLSPFSLYCSFSSLITLRCRERLRLNESIKKETNVVESSGIFEYLGKGDPPDRRKCNDHFTPNVRQYIFHFHF